ncbi:MAG: hypothetical protein FWD57_04475 [Polyangiaceae bacterium]|nr:hypothetical protein [Polyangiaceae bacterium]
MMRLALLGPADGDSVALRNRAQLALGPLGADRVIYLGDDEIFDAALEYWAREIVAGDPSDAALWDRAVKTCAGADHATIDAFVGREREREKLRNVTCLPHAGARAVELFSGVVTLIIHDKALLDRDDLVQSRLIVFGSGSQPTIERDGSCALVSPGPLVHPRGGVLMLEDDASGIVCTILNGAGEQFKQERVVSLSRGVPSMSPGMKA